MRKALALILLPIILAAATVDAAAAAAPPYATVMVAASAVAVPSAEDTAPPPYATVMVAASAVVVPSAEATTPPPYATVTVASSAVVVPSTEDTAPPPYATVNSLMLSSASPAFDRTVYCNAYSKSNLHAVVSKRRQTLYVVERRCTGTALVAAYPVCVGANKGHKQQRGDHRTPESKDGAPFSICQIADASAWRHDFGDGRGSIPAYGEWFLRLEGDFPGSGIGIHGSTGNRYSVPGRGSEGCIRLRDEDIIHFKENYAFVGMNVIIEQD